jgi:hypothetical protein
MNVPDTQQPAPSMLHQFGQMQLDGQLPIIERTQG